VPSLDLPVTWRQVLDYFDAFIIGMTATPDMRTFGFFQQKCCVNGEYKRERKLVN